MATESEFQIRTNTRYQEHELRNLARLEIGAMRGDKASLATLARAGYRDSLEHVRILSPAYSDPNHSLHAQAVKYMARLYHLSSGERESD